MSGLGFLLVIVAFGFLWFVLVRPQKRRRVEQEQMLSTIEIGDEVLTAGGIYGSVVSLTDDEVLLEIAPGTEVRVARRAIAGVVPKEDEEAAAEDEPVEEGEEPAQTAADSDSR
ncbi:MAG TPA: preprotein translocase subunit YajC [Gaiellaceae bacterium]|nr:preprotein translocase subunit YajC [Gaiellaceae bacterium]